VSHPILSVRPLVVPWETEDPFLYCVYHHDAYPAGNGRLGPKATLDGRHLGQDFEGIDGWRMYHGRDVPGFPRHPHRGFETVTIVRDGYVDHSDSLGAKARYGQGDVQWLTAGEGIVHAEMFPLLDEQHPNPLELFQIWLNLPAVEKFAPPHFRMFWAPEVPKIRRLDDAGRASEVLVVAGGLDAVAAPAPPPHSYAAHKESGVAIWTLRLSAKAKLTLPVATVPGVHRNLYFFAGTKLRVGTQIVGQHAVIRIDALASIELCAIEDSCELLLLEGRPIAEPVAAYGPFVMNSQNEVERAFLDYQRTQFGGWPWDNDGPVHGNDARKFARYADLADADVAVNAAEDGSLI
jgi:quercetin 2,3-dioxygenase